VALVGHRFGIYDFASKGRNTNEECYITEFSGQSTLRRRYCHCNQWYLLGDANFVGTPKLKKK
jgi:hypothetical protein